MLIIVQREKENVRNLSQGNPILRYTEHVLWAEHYRHRLKTVHTHSVCSGYRQNNYRTDVYEYLAVVIKCTISQSHLCICTVNNYQHHLILNNVNTPLWRFLRPLSTASYLNRTFITTVCSSMRFIYVLFVLMLV